MARLKAFSGWVIAPTLVKARFRDGRPSTQIQGAVLASSRTAAAAALTEGLGIRYTVSHIDNYFGETDNQETIEALAAHPPGTVLLKGLSPGDTVLGSEDWVVAPPRQKDGLVVVEGTLLGTERDPELAWRYDGVKAEDTSDAASALRDLLDVLDEKMERETWARPWIPANAFQDGLIESAMERGREALR